MKIKIKLTKNQYKALYYVCSNVMPLVRDLPLNRHNIKNYDKLKMMYITETFTLFFMRLTKKMLELKAQNTFSLTLTESYAFCQIMYPIVDKLQTYEKTVIYDILNEINKKTS